MNLFFNSPTFYTYTKTGLSCRKEWQRREPRLEETVELPLKFTELFNPVKDSVRYYYPGNNWYTRIEHYGAKPTYDPEETFII